MVSEKIGAIAAALIMATVCGYLYARNPAVGIGYAVYIFLPGERKRILRSKRRKVK